MELNTKFGQVNIYARTIEEEAMSQIIQMANSPLGENAHIRIMPDCHAGKGCTIGTTMKISDKVCPNLVGADIGCGVDLVKLDINLEDKLEKLDEIIRRKIPFGTGVQKKIQKFDFTKLKCWNELDRDAKRWAPYCMGSLGGGNHFIEAYKDGYVAVHSGSRIIGYKVGSYYQKLAKSKLPETRRAGTLKFGDELAYLTGSDMEDYLHDLKIMQEFALLNRNKMLETISDSLDAKIVKKISSIHNYIDIENKILRKGAISAQKDEILVIPLNMRDGLLVCKGKGNPDWNYSAPHGAGRLYSRSDAKRLITLEDYQKSMKGIFTTCVNESTIDESVFAYKDYKEIMECVEPTVEILERLIPIYNFKASE